MTMDNNLRRYSDPTVVDHYEKAAGLHLARRSSSITG